MRLVVTLLSLGALATGFVVGAAARASSDVTAHGSLTPAQVPSFVPPLPAPSPTTPLPILDAGR